MSDDDKQRLRHGRAALPRRLPSRRGVGEHAPRDDRRRARLPHPRPRAARAGLALAPTARSRPARESRADEDDEGADQTLPKLERDERVDTREVAAAEKETKPPRRFSDASLLGAMEAAGKELDDEELREQMKDSGIGTPATRAAIIERLIDVGYIERDGRALVCTEKGLNVIRLLDEPPADLARPDRRLGAPADRRSSRATSRASASWATSPSSPSRPSPSSTPSSRTSASRGPTSAPAPSAATTSSRTARATRAGRARTRAAAS